MHLGIIGKDRQGTPVSRLRQVVFPLFQVDDPKIIVGHPTVGILLQRIGPKRLLVGVREGPLPADRAKHEEERCTEQGTEPGLLRQGEPGHARESRARRGQRRHVGQVLEVIRHEGIAEEKVIHQPEHRQQRGDEIGQRKSPGPRPGIALPPEQGQYCDHGQCRNIRKRVGCNDVPARINKDQRLRPEQFGEVEPEDFSNENDPLRPAQQPLRIADVTVNLDRK